MMNSINHTRLIVNEIRSDEFQILLKNERKNDLKRLHKRLRSWYLLVVQLAVIETHIFDLKIQI
jgi:hypothetical protein